MSIEHDLVETYVAIHPDDAALAMTGLETSEAVGVLADVSPEAGATLLERMPHGAAARCLTALPAEAASAIAIEMPVQVLATLVRQAGEAGSALVDGLDPEVADPVRRLLAYPAGTAGAALEPVALALAATSSAGDASTLLRRESIRLPDYVYVVDERHVLAGVVNVAALLDATPEAPVSSVTRAGIDWVRVETPLSAVEAHPAWQRFDVLPVVDGEHRLLGVIRHRRLRQLALEGGATTSDDRGVRTLVALGEVYWLGLSGLLQSLATAASRPADTDPQRESR